MQKLRNCPGNPEEMRKGMVQLDLMAFAELRCALCGRPVMAAYQSHPLMIASGVMTLCGEGHAVSIAGALGIANDWRTKEHKAAEKPAERRGYEFL